MESSDSDFFDAYQNLLMVWQYLVLTDSVAAILPHAGVRCDQKSGNAIILMARGRVAPARLRHQDDGVTFARAIKLMALPLPAPSS